MPFLQILHLVLHQGDKRSDYNTYAIHGEGGNLEGYRLATASRHKSKRIFAACYAFDNFQLNTAEILVSPIFPQYVLIFFSSQFQIVLISFLDILPTRFDVLNLQLHLAMLVGILDNVIHNVETALALDETC